MARFVGGLIARLATNYRGSTMIKDTLSGVSYINLYEDIASCTMTVSHGFHQSLADAKRAAKGTCASGRRRLVAIRRMTWYDGQRDN
jgi:hypothetical protein